MRRQHFAGLVLWRPDGLRSRAATACQHASHPSHPTHPCFHPGSLENERDKALTEMNGHFLSNRPIRVSLATAKKNANTTTASAVQAPHPSGVWIAVCVCGWVLRWGGGQDPSTNTASAMLALHPSDAGAAGYPPLLGCAESLLG